MSTVYVGIDNGASGTMGVIYSIGDYKFVKTPVKNCLHWTKEEQHVNRIDYPKFKKMLAHAKKKSKGRLKVFMERPHSNGKQYKASISGARSGEAMLIALEELDIPYEIISSGDWQKPMFPSVNTKRRTEKNKGKRKTRTDKQTKILSLEVGNKLFPKYKEFKHPDRDGLLIAEWARRNKL